MKKISSLVFVYCCISISSYCQTSIPADSAKNYIGKVVTVCSKVFGTKALEKITFINLGAAHPKSPLTVVVFAKDYANFTGNPSEIYADKTICVTGEVKEFKGKIEIAVTKPDEIIINN
jgi:DNA/RNA endonuclease YhcR with UshA esterase domain